MPEVESPVSPAPPLRRVTDQALLQVLESHVDLAPAVQELTLGLVELRRESRDGLAEVRSGLARVETLLERQCTLLDVGNAIRSAELEEAKAARQARQAAADHLAAQQLQEAAQRAAWWRALLEPRTVLWLLVLAAATLLGRPDLVSPHQPGASAGQ